jgi:ubiquinone biosynthesis protein COQ9
MDATDMKDRLLLAVLPNVPFDGWSVAALRAGAREIGLAEAEALALFPRGGPELVAAFSKWADGAMLAAVSGADFEALKVRARIAAAIGARLAALEPHREASRRALALLALPQNVPLGLRLLYDTVDAAWYAAGDTATDFNFYTKRGLLAAVYGATLLYWLDDRSPGSVDTHAFLDRRIAEVMAIPKFTQRLGTLLDRLPNPARFWRAAQRR